MILLLQWYFAVKCMDYTPGRRGSSPRYPNHIASVLWIRKYITVNDTIHKIVLFIFILHCLLLVNSSLNYFYKIRKCEKSVGKGSVEYIISKKRSCLLSP